MNLARPAGPALRILHTTMRISASRFLAAALAGGVLLAATGVSAQTLTSLRLEPGSATVGQEVRITAQLEVPEKSGINCGLRIVYGDGKSVDLRISKESDIPAVVRYTFTRPGTFTVSAEPKIVGITLPCSGKTQKQVINVSEAKAAPAAGTYGAAVGVAAAGAAAKGGPAPVPAPAATAPAVSLPDATTCPWGWNLNRQSINPRTGAFVCNGTPDSVAPTEKLTCATPLVYFEQLTGANRQIGCRLPNQGSGPPARPAATGAAPAAGATPPAAGSAPATPRPATPASTAPASSGSAPPKKP
jgi:predicted thioesterase